MGDEGNNTWLGRYPIIEASHSHDLEARSAIHEFRNRLPRADAEDRAHQDYMREQSLDAAAHHLVGIRTAHAGGHSAAAERHGAGYAAAMAHTGMSPYEQPPKEVLDRIKKVSLYAFKPHAADVHFAPKEQGTEDNEADEHIRDLINKLEQTRQAMQRKPKDAE